MEIYMKHVMAIVIAALIIIGAVYCFFTNNLTFLNNEIINSAKDSFNMVIDMFPVIALWLGIMNIANKSGLLDKISNLISLAVITFLLLSSFPITITSVPTNNLLFKNARLKIDTPTTPEEVTSLKFILLSPALKRIKIGTLSILPSIISKIPLLKKSIRC